MKTELLLEIEELENLTATEFEELLENEDFLYTYRR